MKECALDDYGDDDDDSEYEYMGGDMSLYESKLDEHDEIHHLQKGLMNLDGGNNVLYQRLLSGITDASQMEKFKEILNGIETLITKEKSVR